MSSTKDGPAYPGVGYPGAYPNSSPSGYPPQPPRPPPKKGLSGWMVALIVLGGLGLMMGPCSVLGIYGVRKYLANAKTAEARNTVGHLARLAVAAYERDRRLCPSARHPVPSNTDKIRGVKYQAARGEWTNDAPSRAGFACLGFEMAGSQYYQYDYRADGRSFTVTARGDLDGDGELSTFKISGQLLGEDLVVTPSIEETSPEE